MKPQFTLPVRTNLTKPPAERRPKHNFLLGGLGSRPLCVQLALSFSDTSTVLCQPPLASEVECCISRP